MAVDAREVDALPGAAGGFQHGGPHEALVGKIVGGTAKPGFVAPRCANEHIGKPQAKVNQDDQGRCGHKTGTMHCGKTWSLCPLYQAAAKPSKRAALAQSVRRNASSAWRSSPERRSPNSWPGTARCLSMPL